MKNKKLSIFLWTLYIVFLAYVLLLRRIGSTHYGTYTEYILQNCNLIPGKGIYIFATTPVITSSLILQLLKNYLGNILIFIPWGVLAMVSSKSLSIKNIVITAGIVVLVIELLQLLTMLGSFDVEDVILNITGVLIGCLFCRNKNK